MVLQFVSKDYMEQMHFPGQRASQEHRMVNILVKRTVWF